MVTAVLAKTAGLSWAGVGLVLAFENRLHLWIGRRAALEVPLGIELVERETAEQAPLPSREIGEGDVLDMMRDDARAEQVDPFVGTPPGAGGATEMQNETVDARFTATILGTA